MLCPDCLGRAGENEFLRFRLKRALAERSGQPGATDQPERGPGSPLRTVAPPASPAASGADGSPGGSEAD